MKIIFSLLLLCLFQLPGASQEPFTLGGTAHPHKELGQASATFNPGKNHPTVAVQTNPLRLVGNTTEGLYLSPNFIVQGRKLLAPAAIDVEVLSYSSQRRFTSTRAFQIRDQTGRALHAQPLALLTSGKSDTGIFTEVLVAKIPYGTFVKLIKEDSLVFVVGKIQF